MPFPHASRVHTSLRQSGELLPEAIVNQRQFASNNLSNNNLFSSISNSISNNKSVIDGISASVSNIQNTINTNQTKITQGLANLSERMPNIDKLKSVNDNFFNKKNVRIEQVFSSINNNIRHITDSVLFSKNLISNPDDFIRRYENNMDYSSIRRELEVKYAKITELSSANVSIWSTNFESSDTTSYKFLYNNIMFSKYSILDFNNQDNTSIIDLSLDNDSYTGTITRKIADDLSNMLNNYLELQPETSNFYQLFTNDRNLRLPYDSIIYAYFFKNSGQWSVIFSTSILQYDSIFRDKSIYRTFIDAINSMLNTWDASLNDSEKPISRDVSTFIEIGPPLAFESLKCVSSPIPGWSGKLVSQLKMTGSFINVSNEYKDTINQLWNNFSGLSENDIVIITSTLENDLYCNIIKIIDIERQLCFSQKQINIRDFFSSIEMNNDLIINGNFEVKNMLGENVMKNDNVKNIMTIGQKVGINQDVHQVKGLLDIDNMANKTLDIILNNFTKPLLDSYELTEGLKQYLVLDTINNKYVLDSSSDFVKEILTEYKFATFSCPVLLSISENDVSFDITEANEENPDIIFSSRKLAMKSFGSIKAIVSNLHTMLTSDGLILDDKISILSFVELLEDGNNKALCSLRAIIKPNIKPNNEDGYLLYFFVTYSIINTYYYDNSYKKNIETLCNAFSKINQFLNYANFLVEDPTIKTNLLQGKTDDIEGDTFSGHINNSSYFRYRFGDSQLYIGIFNYPGDQSLFLLHEAYRWFENKPGVANFIPNTDVQMDTVIDIIYKSHISRFGEYKMEYIFPVQYDFNMGPKMSFVKVIEIDAKKYVMFCGMNISDYIDLSIVSKGDNKITGNLSVVDEGTNNNIFNVDIVNKMCSSMYNTGIGTNNPKTKLDINDCGVVDVIEIINNMAERMNEMNNILVNLKTYMAENDDQNLDYFFNSQSQLHQDPTHYYSVNQLIFDNFNNVILPNVIITYHNLYPTWNNKTVKYILDTDIQHKSSINFLYKAIQNASINNMYFHDSLRLVSYDWINGVKLSLAITFKVNNKFYLVLTGLDLQTSVTINTNSNIRALTNIQAACANILQDMVPYFQNIPDSEILNKDISKTNRVMNINQFIKNIRLFKYDIDSKNVENTRVTLLDNQTYEAKTPEQILSTLTGSSDKLQLRNKITFINLGLNQYYGTSLVSGQYGTLHVEDDYLDFIIMFWVKSNTNGILTIYSQEITIKDVLIQSLQLRGDAVIKGDLYMYDTVKNENFLFIDSNNRFMGFNTSQVYGNYSNGYATTSNSDLAKHNVYIRTNSFPNTVIERQSENPLAAFSPNWQPNPYYYFQSYSTLSSRRQSDYFTFDDMAKYKDLYWAKNESNHPNAYGTDRINQYAYGTVVSFEVKDKTGVIKELGGMGVLMESIETVTDTVLNKEFNDIRGAFEVTVLDRLKGTPNVNLRQIMYCSNDSNLYVNNVTTNKINFNNNEKLVTGQVSGQPYKKPAPVNKTGQLFVDPVTGDLMFTNSAGVNKKVVLQDP